MVVSTISTPRITTEWSSHERNVAPLRLTVVNRAPVMSARTNSLPRRSVKLLSLMGGQDMALMLPDLTTVKERSHHRITW